MQYFSPHNNGYVYKCKTYPVEHLGNPRLVEAKFNSDLANSNLTIDDLLNKTIVLDTMVEGWTDTDAWHIISHLCKYTSLDYIKVLYGSAIDTNNLPYEAVSLPMYMASHRHSAKDTKLEDRKLLDIAYKFLCLARRPNLIRAKTVSSLLKTIDSIQASFGTDSTDLVDSYQPYFKNHTLPIIVDEGSISYSHTQYFENSSASMFNVVLETSSQHDVGWSSIFFTEKTFKSYYDFQIPLWVTTPGTVTKLREFGFDMFDDIVDHSYDLTVDENTRIEKVVSQVKKLDATYSIEDLQDFRKPGSPIRQRLDYNYNKLREYAAQSMHSKQQAIEQFLK